MDAINGSRIMTRVQRMLALAACLGSIGALTPASVRAETSVATSPASEVDACNQAQYRMPAGATVRGFRINSSSIKGVQSFSCTVRWTTKAGAKPTGQPILFPNPISAPLFSL